MATRFASRLTSNPAIYVGNIPWTVGSQELREYFGQFAKVVRANIVFDKETGLHRGFGFVVFKDKEGIQNVLKQDIHKLEGRAVDVKIKEMSN